ncbi:MAG: FeoB-associated Cys-rich membrane protein [Pyramidobacter sp.]
MNRTTILILAVIAAAAAAALRHVSRKKGCSCGSCSGCPLSGKCSRPREQNRN